MLIRHRNYAHKLQFQGSLQSLAEPRRFRGFLRQLFQENWVVYAKPPFGGPEHVLHFSRAIPERFECDRTFRSRRQSPNGPHGAKGLRLSMLLLSPDEDRTLSAPRALHNSDALAG